MSAAKGSPAALEQLLGFYYRQHSLGLEMPPGISEAWETVARALGESQKPPRVGKSTKSRDRASINPSKTEARILKFITQNPGMYRRAIAEEMKLYEPSVCSAVDKLLKLGLVKRGPEVRSAHSKQMVDSLYPVQS